MMINGAHVVVYSKDAEADKAFLRDVLDLRSVDAGHGWLIFGLPPAEVAVHPSDENDRHERQVGVGLELATGLDAVQLRHHHVEQDQIGMVQPRHRHGFFAVGRFQHIVALRTKAGAQDVAIGLVVIDNENARRRMHGRPDRGR